MGKNHPNLKAYFAPERFYQDTQWPEDARITGNFLATLFQALENF